MASTPSVTPGNAFGLPLKQALSMLLDTLPVAVPVPLHADQQYPQALSRKCSGIVYKSRDDDSSLFQLASAIVLTDESIDVTDVTDDVQVPVCSVSEGTALEIGRDEDNGLQESCGPLYATPESDLAHRTVSEAPQSSACAHNVKADAVITTDGHSGDGQEHGVGSVACVRGRRSSSIPLPTPRERTLIKSPNTDNSIDSVTDPGLDFPTSSGRKLSATKIDILHGPRRTPGSGPGSVCEGSVASTTSSHNALHTGLGSTYGDGDYAEYPQGTPSLPLCTML